MDSHGSMHGTSDLPVMSGGFGDHETFQHPEDGRPQMDGPEGLGVTESDASHAQEHCHAQTYEQGGLHPPTDVSFEQNRLQTPPTSFPLPVSSIGSFEAHGAGLAHGSAPRHISAPLPWSTSPRDYRTQQPDAINSVNSVTQALQQPHQAHLQRQQEPLHAQQQEPLHAQQQHRQQRHHSLEQDHYQQSTGTLGNSGTGFEQLNPHSKQQQQLRHMNSQATSLEQHEPSGRCDQQHQQELQRSWLAQTRHDLGKQQKQQQQNQQQQSQQRVPITSLLNDYVPPVAFTQLNVHALMQHTAATVDRWNKLLETLDVTSESSTSNLSSQARARASLKRDLTNLTQLADAQTKHMQRTKMRYIQEAPIHGGVSAPSTVSTSLLVSAASAGIGGLMCEDYNHPAKASSIPVSAARGAPSLSSALAPGISIGAVLMQQDGGGEARGSSSATQANYSEEPGTGWQPTDWSSSTSSPRPTALPNPPSPAIPPQHAIPLQHRIHEVKQRLERAEPRNKWVVLVDASLRLLSHEGSTFEQLFVNIQSFLKKYNGQLGVEIALALQSCFDQCVFDPTDITRAQQRMAEIYSQCARRGQR